jgi:hypothetical protein
MIFLKTNINKTLKHRIKPSFSLAQACQAQVRIELMLASE